MFFQRARQPKIQPVTLTVGAYTGDLVTASRLIERNTKLGAFAITIKEQAALTDHFALNLEHNNYVAIGGPNIDADSGVPIGMIAGNPRFLFAAGQPAHRVGIAPWPGRLNNIGALENLRLPVVRKFGPSSPEALELSARLGLAYALPATPWPMTIWPLEGGKTFTLAMRRLAGSVTTITEVILWCIKLPEDLHRNVCTFAELPFWSNLKLNLASGTGVDGQFNLEINAKESYGLLLKQILAQGYSDNAGVITYDEINVQNTRANVRYEANQFYDNIANSRVSLSEQWVGFMQDYDMPREFNVMINPKSKIIFDVERSAATPFARDIYLDAYGIVAEAEQNLMQALPPSIMTM